MSIFDNPKIFEACTVTRYAVGAYTDGIYVDGITSTINITASVQPLQPRELLMLPEGERTRENVWIHTQTELKTINTATGEKADVLTRDRDSRQYEIQHVKQWVQLSIPHFRCRGTRLNA